MNKRFPSYRQLEAKDCGPTCVKIIAKYYGKGFNLEYIRELTETNRAGTSIKSLADASEILGFRTLAAKLSIKELSEVPLPCILHWSKSHYVVLYKTKKDKFFLSDPAFGLVSYSKKDFVEEWIGKNVKDDLQKGIALLFEPTLEFYQNESQIERTQGWGFLYHYLKRHRKFIIQLMVGLLAGSILQLIFPFLSQSVVDIGIRNQDINFVYLILLAQLFLFIGRSSIEIIRSWILLHLSTRISISLLSDFFIKIMGLPIAFFDTRLTGDLLQRISDHKRIERLLTTSSLNVLFAIFNIIVFGIVLGIYDPLLLGIFFLGTVLYIAWVLIFLKKRRVLDYKSFAKTSEEHSQNIQLINGMQEIKLHNAERQFRWDWEHLQARLFKISIDKLRLDQFQNIGAGIINELKNIILTIISAKLVIQGEITLGMLLAISYIIGQLNAPIADLVSFIRDAQDAKISLERLEEIHSKENEERKDLLHEQIPEKLNFHIEKISYKYPGAIKNVLKGVTLNIPANKVTAIVGPSGSGKTTLIKLLLKYYEPQSGDIRINTTKLSNISARDWREVCGTVMQDGYIFNNTIARNIAVGEDIIDKLRLIKSLEIADIREFIEELPLSYNTKIGNEGIGLSAGQKQRILIARAIYRNPKCLVFDEPTSALDANTERRIISNLNSFFQNRTVLIIAHRLSTVQQADQIVVLDQGIITEVGTHNELIGVKGGYYRLVKNQLELGS